MVAVVVLIVIWIISESWSSVRPILESFVAPPRADTGFAADGWGEDSGYERDLRFTEGFVDVRGAGRPIDFCRAVQRVKQPDTRRIVCALGTRDGLSTREWAGPSTQEGFRWSRDDYWRPPAKQGGRSAYCRILKDTNGTNEFSSFCTVAGPDGFRRGPDEHDAQPPPAIQKLLQSYSGALVWWRWQDDDGDYTDNTIYEVHGDPIPPSEGAPIRTTAARGFQFNRWPPALQDAGESAAPPIRDYLRWGESSNTGTTGTADTTGSLDLDQIVPPRQIRAFAAWIWWDAIEAGAAIWESSNGGKRELVRLFAEGGGLALPGIAPVRQAEEVRPEVIAAIGQLTEPATVGIPTGYTTSEPKPLSQTASYIFEIWDTDGRLVRLESGAGTLKARQWQHVVITTADATAWWPTWQIWIDGVLMAEMKDGRAIPAMTLTQNYLCRGFRGCIQDVRFYNEPLTQTRIRAAKEWSGAKLHPQP